MEIEKITELIEVLVSLVNAVAWQLVVVFIVIFLGKPLKKIISNVSEFSFKAGEFEAQAKTREIEAAAAIGAAIAKKDSELSTEDETSIEHESFEIAGLVNRVFQPRIIRRLTDRTILWVDDRPENNVYERNALESLGIKVSISTSTESALKMLSRNNYDVIISDMGRPPDQRAGYTLLSEIKKMGIDTPFIIYASGANLPKHKAKAQQRGAYGSTNRATELLEMVVSNIN